MRRTPVLAGVALVLAVGLAGCAGEDVQANPATTAETFLNAVIEKDLAAMCGLLADDDGPLSAAEVQRCISSGGGVLGLFMVQAEGAGIGSVRVESATVTGARAEVSGSDLSEGEGLLGDMRLTLEKIGDDWWIAIG
ncbi:MULTISPECIES: hypothetical protein [unclassified Microbacterium]|uniref:hypothetical protein n=1 Tax=unclassified Microbacterium TaxID=2609290 RepID=UPI00300F822B